MAHDCCDPIGVLECQDQGWPLKGALQILLQQLWVLEDLMQEIKTIAREAARWRNSAAVFPAREIRVRFSGEIPKFTMDEVKYWQ